MNFALVHASGKPSWSSDVVFLHLVSRSKGVHTPAGRSRLGRQLVRRMSNHMALWSKCKPVDFPVHAMPTAFLVQLQKLAQHL